MPQLFGRRQTSPRDAARTATIPPTGEGRDAPTGIEPDTARAVADFAAKAYADENTRTKDLDGKAGPTIAAAGAAILFAAGALAKPPDILSVCQSRAYFFGIFVGIVLVAIAQGFFLWMLRPRTYHRPTIGTYSTPEAMQRKPEDIHWQMAIDFDTAIQKHHAENETKATCYQRGVYFLLAGVAILTATLIFVGTIASKVWP